MRPHNFDDSSAGDGAVFESRSGRVLIVPVRLWCAAARRELTGAGGTPLIALARPNRVLECAQCCAGFGFVFLPFVLLYIALNHG